MRKKSITLLLSLVFVCSLFLLMTGCTQKTIPPVSPSPDASSDSYQSGNDSSSALSDIDATDSDAVRNDRLSDMDSSSQVDSVSEMINFAYDSSELNEESRAILKKIKAVLQPNPSYLLDISGHCDERGTIEYNLALGERRARSAKKFLVAMGISPDRISTISYGEESPIDPRSTEDAWAKNRRDAFKLIK